MTRRPLLALLGLGLGSCGTVDDSVGAAPIELTLASTEHPAVFRATWSTPRAADATLEYGLDGDFDRSMVLSSDADGIEHSGLVFGLGEGQTWSLRAVSTPTDGGGDWVSETVEVEVPYAPAELPGYTRTVADEAGVLDGFYVVTHSGEGNSWVVIYDNAGRRVWWGAGDADAQLVDTWLSVDGTEVHALDMGVTPSIRVMALDGSRAEDVPVEGIHHSFFPLVEGGWATLQSDPREWEGATVVGDRLIELAPDGSVSREIWSTWDDLAPTGEDEHTNSVWLDEDSGDYLVSLRDRNSIVAVGADGSGLKWGVGDDFPELVLTEGEGFHTQHGVLQAADGLYLFNNRDYQDGEHALWSEAVRYEVDREAGTWRRTWAYDADQLVFSPVLGNVIPLPDGGRMVSFGMAGRVLRLDAEDTPVFQIDGDLGAPNGYCRWVPQIAGATR